MLNVFLNNEIVFSGTSEEVDKYCENNEWDYTQDTSYSDYERACGIYF